MAELEFVGESIKLMIKILLLLIIIALLVPWVIKKLLTKKGRTCSTCGYQLSQADRFCPRCGKKVEE